MQQSARYCAVLEIITQVFEGISPADNIINEYMRARKYIGSKDRKFIIDCVWDIIRNRRKLEFDIKSTVPRDVLICYLKDKDLEEVFDGSKYGLEKLSPNEKMMLNRMSEDVYPPDIEVEVPKWLFDKIGDERLLRSFNTQAPADFRINTKSRESVLDDMKAEGFVVVETPYSPFGIRSPGRINLANCIAYQEGKIEVQDEASQLVSVLCDVQDNEKVVDYCAGAGGKSLALAYLSAGKAKIDAHDINWHRLEQIKPRIERLGAKGIEVKRTIDDVDYDKFIIDVPCSGTGTWRRSPDAKYRLNDKKLKELNKIQSELLQKAYKHIKPGGRIIYITCSILKDENEDIILKFLDENMSVNLLNLRNIWGKKVQNIYPCENEHMLRLSPLASNTDGFFMAILERKS